MKAPDGNKLAILQALNTGGFIGQHWASSSVLAAQWVNIFTLCRRWGSIYLRLRVKGIA